MKNSNPISEIPTNTLIVILGPTASGKTEAAIRLAEKLSTGIISADSRQFYREMSIGTARPDPGQLARADHHLVGHLSVRDYYNVARFEKDALRILKRIFQDQTYAIMVGGSGLYIDAVCQGIDALPDPDLELRDSLKRQLKENGLEHIQTMLLELDPEYHSKVDLKNPSRILRALEVCLMTGRPYSSFLKNQPLIREFKIEKYGLDLPRDILNQRIDERVDRMMIDGLLDEVKALQAFRDLNALKTVGYKELFDYLDGTVSLEVAVEKIKTNTRRYAKRQMTWFRKDEAIRWVKDWDELPYL